MPWAAGPATESLLFCIAMKKWRLERVEWNNPRQSACQSLFHLIASNFLWHKTTANKSKTVLPSQPPLSHLSPQFLYPLLTFGPRWSALIARAWHQDTPHIQFLALSCSYWQFFLTLYSMTFLHTSGTVLTCLLTHSGRCSHWLRC